jgi:60 kDa SS-A/Ro ribonucleoprotein
MAMRWRSTDAVISRPASGGGQPEPGMTHGLAGQWTYTAEPKLQLIRALTTNTLTDTYYATRRDLAEGLVDLCLTQARDDPAFLAKAAVWASMDGRALNNTAPNVALAALAGVKTPEALHWYGRAFVPILRTPRHLFEHVELLRKGALGRRSLGRRPRHLVRAALARLSGYQAVKYRSRAGLRDLLRLTHPPDDGQGLFRWLVTGDASATSDAVIQAYVRLTEATEDTTRIQAIEDAALPWEAVLPVVPRPSFGVWTALLGQMPYEAMLRHLSAVSRHGTLPESLVAHLVERLTDVAAIRQAKILPFKLNAALAIYAAGGRGGHSRHALHDEVAFSPDPRLIRALEEAIERSFANWHLPGRVIILTDVSGSMRSGGLNEGALHTYLDVAALFTAAAVQSTDGQARVIAFNESAFEVRWPRPTFADIVRAIKQTPSGGTNMAAGFAYLTRHHIPADLVIGITDNESWAGGLTIDALREYCATQRPQTICLVTIAPYADSVAPLDEPQVYQMAGWSPAIGEVIQLMAHGHDQIAAIHAMVLVS